MAAPAADRTILAIGAHCGDMEVTSGAVLAKHKASGDRIVLLHLSLGEGGNPAMSPEKYGEQRRKESLAAAKVLGAEVIFGPYKDGQLPNNDEIRRYVADVIRQVKPTHVFTHWRRSIHKDHTTTHSVVVDSVLMAAVENVVTSHPHYRGVRAIYYTDNWEDTENFSPYVYINVTGFLPIWKEAVLKYELYRGGVVSYPYLAYYEAMATVRGAQAGTTSAVAFNVDEIFKKRILETLP
jgi:LmbE family N-acetylglucosaminyl deacetylase